MKEHIVQNTRSRLEARLARMVAAPARLAPPRPADRPRIDLVFLSDKDQKRLDSLLP